MMGDWTFFSNYGHVLVCLANNSEARLRDVALQVGITERAAQKIVKDLQYAGFLTVTKQGRCNRYRINKRKCLRHGLESHCNVGKLLSLVTKPVKVGKLKSHSLPDQVETKQPDPLLNELPPAEIETRYPAETGKISKKQDSKKQDSKKSAKENEPVDTRQQGSLF